MGATAVLLSTVFARAEGVGPQGRAAMSFFAPDPVLAVGKHSNAPSQELKQAIKELHAQGIEVILQVSVWPRIWARAHLVHIFHSVRFGQLTCQSNGDCKSFENTEQYAELHDGNAIECIAAGQ